MSLEIRPITLRAANAYVAQYHRHNIPTNGHKWSLAVYDGDRLCGVAIAGQPVARRLDDGMTIEVRRVCTDGTHNACSALYGACARVAKEMGYARILTYTLATEPGTSLKASGWKDCGECGGVLGMCLPDREKSHRQHFSEQSRNTLSARNADGRNDLRRSDDA